MAIHSARCHPYIANKAVRAHRVFPGPQILAAYWQLLQSLTCAQSRGIEAYKWAVGILTQLVTSGYICLLS